MEVENRIEETFSGQVEELPDDLKERRVHGNPHANGIGNGNGVISTTSSCMRPLSWLLRAPMRRPRRRCVNCSSLSSGALSSPLRTSELASRDATIRWWTSALTSLKLTTSWRDGFSDVVRPESSMMTLWRKCRAGEGRDLSLRATVVSSRTAHSSGEDIQQSLWWRKKDLQLIIKNNIGGFVPASYRYLLRSCPVKTKQMICFNFINFWKSPRIEPPAVFCILFKF